MIILNLDNCGGFHQAFKALCLLSPRALFTWQKHRHFVIKNRNSAKKKKKNNDTVRAEENKKTYCLDMLDININLYLLDTLDIIFFQMDINVF